MSDEIIEAIVIVLLSGATIYVMFEVVGLFFV